MRPIDVVRKVAPLARVDYLTAIERGDGLFRQHGITTPLRLAHFLAQILHETGGLTITEESLNYATAARIAAVWPTRFTVATAAPFIHNARALAIKVYGDRLGNRPGTDDGWTYRGRGLMQTTGREGYARMGRLCGVDFEARPELVVSAEHALKPALAEWTAGNLNAAADRDDLHAITRRINGGTIGLDSRAAWLAKLKPLIASVDLVDRPAPIPPPPDIEPIEPRPAPVPAEPSWGFLVAMWTAVQATVLSAAHELGAHPWLLAGLFILVLILAVCSWPRR